MREDRFEKCSLGFPGLAYKLAASLVNGIKSNLHSIIVFVLVPVWITCEHCICVLTRILKLYFTARKKDGS